MDYQQDTVVVTNSNNRFADGKKILLQRDDKKK